MSHLVYISRRQVIINELRCRGGTLPDSVRNHRHNRVERRWRRRRWRIRPTSAEFKSTRRRRRLVEDQTNETILRLFCVLVGSAFQVHRWKWSRWGRGQHWFLLGDSVRYGEQAFQKITSKFVDQCNLCFECPSSREWERHGYNLCSWRVAVWWLG